MAMVVNLPPSHFLAGELTPRIDKPQIKMYMPAPGQPRASNSWGTRVPFEGTPLTENRVVPFLITVYSPTKVAKVGAKRVKMSVLLQNLYLLGLSNSTQMKALKGRFLSISTTYRSQSLQTMSSKELRRERRRLVCTETTRTLQKLDSSISTLEFKYRVNTHYHRSKAAAAATMFLNIR